MDAGALRGTAGTLLAAACCLMPLAAPAAGKGPAGAGEPDARRIMDGVAGAYYGCATYLDSGVIRSVYRSASGEERTYVKYFATAFHRPGRFRFEYSEAKQGVKETQYVVWRDGAGVRTWFASGSGDRVKTETHIGQAIAGATGVSGGTAPLISSMLLPEFIEDNRIFGLKEMRRLKDKDLNGVQCYRVKGYKLEEPWTLWIEKSTYLVLKIEAGPDETITYWPAFNRPLQAGALDFNPPGTYQ